MKVEGLCFVCCQHTCWGSSSAAETQTGLVRTDPRVFQGIASIEVDMPTEVKESVCCVEGETGVFSWYFGSAKIA